MEATINLSDEETRNFSIKLNTLFTDAVAQLKSLGYFILVIDRSENIPININGKLVVMLPGKDNYVSFRTVTDFYEITGIKRFIPAIIESWVTRKVFQIVDNSKNYRIESEKLKCERMLLSNNRYIANFIFYLEGYVEFEIIDSVHKYLENVFIYDKSLGSTRLFFRGQLANWSMDPSLYREKAWIENEAELNARILSNRPEDFQNCNSYFEKLVVLKHFNQPSRLLDITTNPLIALYFACTYMEKHKEGIGVVNCIYSKNPEKEKYAIMSDTVKMITALCYTKNVCKDCTCVNCGLANKNCKLINELRYQLKQQSSAEEWNNLSLDKLDTCILVHPPMNNPRIVRQQGLFLMCGRSRFDNLRRTGLKNNLCDIKYSVPKDLCAYFTDTQGKRKIFLIPRNQNSPDNESTLKSLIKQLSILGIDNYFVFGELDRAIETEKLRMLEDISRREY